MKEYWAVIRNEKRTHQFVKNKRRYNDTYLTGIQFNLMFFSPYYGAISAVYVFLSRLFRNSRYPDFIQILS